MSSNAACTATNAFIPAHRAASRPTTSTIALPLQTGWDRRRSAADERQVPDGRVDDVLLQIGAVLQHETQDVVNTNINGNTDRKP